MNKQEIEKDVEILKYYEAQDYFFSKDMPALHAFRRAISALEQQLTNGWIPVSERIPEKIYKVTATIRNKLNGYVFVERIRWIENKFWWSNGNIVSEKFVVLAWMPDGLPEPYKEETK